MDSRIPEVVIIGGGFGGLYAAQSLRRAKVKVTLVDRRNFHLFQPLLYQVATGALSPANIAAPLRCVLSQQKNAKVILGEVADFDLANREVILTDMRLPYNYLIVAAGARHAYFGRPEWEELAPGLKSIEDATEIRRRVLYAFEMAERTADVKPVCDCWLTFVIVGGGPTGVELAGAIRELAKYTLQRNFRAIDPARARVLLVQSGNRLLPAFHEKLSENALKALKKMGVEVRLHSRVTHIEAHKVGIKGPDGDEEVEASNVIWAAGVQASPLASKLAQASGAALDKSGRVAVQPDLSLPGYPEVFAVGDMAQIPWKEGQTVPGVAPAAMQSGAHAGKVIMAQLAGKERPAFVYFDKGSMATIGRAQAVAEAKGLRLTGFTGWMAWLFVHIMYLARFENRVLVLWQWFWNYLTRNRAARLITGEVPRNLAIDSLEQGMNEVVPPQKKAMMAEMMAKPKPQSAAAS